METKIKFEEIRLYVVKRRVMADYYTKEYDEKPERFYRDHNYGDYPLSDYLEDIQYLFECQESVELSKIKEILRSSYSDVIDIELANNN